jgi:acyl-phosphate glycerol 3-phosphate acyltransferase
MSSLKRLLAEADTRNSALQIAIINTRFIEPDAAKSIILAKDINYALPSVSQYILSDLNPWKHRIRFQAQAASPWLNFKGGKGVATSAGVLLGLAPAVLIWTAAIWAISFAVKRIVSVSSLLAATAFPFLVLWLEPGRHALLLVAFILAGLVWYRHRDNLQRLVQGTENGFGKKTAGAGKKRKKR